MRSELETLQLIDQYLEGSMNAENKAAFESEIATNQELKVKVETQSLLIKAIKRKALKAEIAALSNTSSFGLNSSFLAGLAVTTILTAAMSFLQLKEIESPLKNAFVPTSTEQNFTETQIVETITDDEGNSVLSFEGLHVWEQPEIQSFMLDAGAGATIEGNDGTLVIVPTDAFVDADGNSLDGDIKVELIEALTLDKMVMYNLTTQSDGRSLKTGGMIKINYSQNGREVNVNPERPLLVQIPTEEIHPEMQLFEGEVTEEGNLNWKNPKPLEKFLVNVEFELLDFKPDGFASAVKSLAKESMYFGQEEAELDSIYYSLNWETDQAEEASLGSTLTRNLFSTSQMKGFSQSVVIEDNDLEMQEDSVADEIRADSTMEEASFCGINPRSIETIKSPAYAKTFIATREFADRLTELHKLKDGDKYLKLYLKNLKMDLWQIDSMVANQLKGDESLVFHRFAKEKLTNVKDLNIHQYALNDYYFRKLAKKKKEAKERNKAAIKKSNAELRIALTKIQQEKQAAISALPTPSNAPLNLRPSAVAAYSQPTRINPNSVVNSASYSFYWASSAWANIDSYMKLLEGTARIVGVSLDANFKNRKVYQWINTVKTLVNLNIGADGKYQARFPEFGNPGSNQMKETFVLAVSEKEGEYEWALETYRPYEVTQLELEAKVTDKDQIKRALRDLGVANLGVIKRFEEEAKQLKAIIAERKAFIRQNKVYNDSLKQINARYNAETRKVLEKKRLRDVQNRKDLMQVLSLINPCGVTTILSDNNEEIEVVKPDDINEVKTVEAQIFNVVEVSPVLNGGKEALKSMVLNSSVSYDKSINGIVYVQLVVNEDGTASDFKVLRSPSEDISRIALDILQEGTLKFTPGKQRGKPVKSYFSLPIQFGLK